MKEKDKPNFQIKDSGSRQQFASGAVRDCQSGKGRFDLLPPVAILRLAQHFENGSKKYSERNWEQGIPLSRYLDSAMRHLNKLLAGLKDEDHAAAAMWNIACYIHTEEMIRLGKLPEDLAKGLPDYGQSYMLSEESNPKKTRNKNGTVKAKNTRS